MNWLRVSRWIVFMALVLSFTQAGGFSERGHNWYALCFAGLGGLLVSVHDQLEYRWRRKKREAELWARLERR